MFPVGRRSSARRRRAHRCAPGAVAVARRRAALTARPRSSRAARRPNRVRRDVADLRLLPHVWRRALAPARCCAHGARPTSTPVMLRHSRIYILPTRRGLALIGTLAMMLLTSLNYALSLGFAVTFLVGGLVAAALLHTFRNLAGIEVAPLARRRSVRRRHAGVHAVADRRRLPRAAITRRAADGSPARPSTLPPARALAVTLERADPGARTRRARTRHAVVRFPARPVARLGLRALSADRQSCIRRRKSARRRCRQERDGADGAASGGEPTMPISRACATTSAGDPPQRVAWKAVARGARLVHEAIRGQPAAGPVELDWASLPPRSTRSAPLAAHRLGARRRARDAAVRADAAGHGAAAGPGPRPSPRRADRARAVPHARMSAHRRRRLRRGPRRPQAHVAGAPALSARPDPLARRAALAAQLPQAPHVPVWIARLRHDAGRRCACGLLRATAGAPTRRRRASRRGRWRCSRSLRRWSSASRWRSPRRPRSLASRSCSSWSASSSSKRERARRHAARLPRAVPAGHAVLLRAVARRGARGAARDAGCLARRSRRWRSDHALAIGTAGAARSARRC